jgi:nicotinate-nucleotide adenylyltransferase
MIGILGGTFDPVHYGHLRTALEIQQALNLEQIRWIPAARPPHRDAPRISADARARLVEAAIADQPGFVLDTRELQRPGPSYMVDTLDSLRAEFKAAPLCLILGSDAFAHLHTWNEWTRLFELAHLVVMQRGGQAAGWTDALAGELRQFLQERRTDRREELAAHPHGRIYLQDVSALAISATHIRELIAAGKSPRYLLPDGVLKLIEQHHYYRNRH